MKLSRRYQILLLVFLVLGIYYPLLFAPFNSVDDVKMVNAILNDESTSFWKLLLPHSSAYYYRPLLYYTFVLDKPFWGLEASFMHLENVLYHALNVVLVFLVAERGARRCGITGTMVPLAAAVLFALHPVNTEPVNWISGRTDLMAATFVLAAVYALLTALDRNAPLIAVAGAFFFFLGTLCKETAVFFLPASLLLTLFDLEGGGLALLFRKARERVRFYLPFLIATACYFYLRHAALSQSDSGAAMTAARALGIGPHPQTGLNDIVKVLGFYAAKLFFPWPLNFAIAHVPDLYLVPGLLVLVCCCYLLWRRDLIAAFFLTALALISPAFLVLITRMAWTPIAERYLYIPCAFFCIASALLCWRAAARFGAQKTAALLPLSVLLVAAWGTYQRNLVWQDNLTLFQDAVRKSPDFAPARNELAIALLEHGRKAEGSRLLKENRADSSVKNSEVSVLNRAWAMADEGDLAGARKLLLQTADPKTPNYPSFLNGLIANDLRRLGTIRDPQIKRAVHREVAVMCGELAERTGDPFCWYRCGRHYLEAGDPVPARKAFARAYAEAPVTAYYRQPAKALADKLAGRNQTPR